MALNGHTRCISPAYTSCTSSPSSSASKPEASSSRSACSFSGCESHMAWIDSWPMLMRRPPRSSSSQDGPYTTLLPAAYVCELTMPLSRPGQRSVSATTVWWCVALSGSTYST